LDQTKLLIVPNFLREHKIVVVGVKADVESVSGLERPGTVSVLISCQKLDVNRTRHSRRVEVKVVLVCSQIKTGVMLSYCYVSQYRSVFTDLLSQKRPCELSCFEIGFHVFGRGWNRKRKAYLGG
jgi:hypothetical protein